MQVYFFHPDWEMPIRRFMDMHPLPQSTIVLTLKDEDGVGTTGQRWFTTNSISYFEFPDYPGSVHLAVAIVEYIWKPEISSKMLGTYLDKIAD